MSHNTFGRLFRFTTWGESHGPAIGCVVDGAPPGIPLAEADIQHWLDRRRPGQSRFVTQRREPDQVEILSGVFAGRTTGTPVSLLIRNHDQRERDYERIKDEFRPGHADYTYWAKYSGIRDYRGGGRSSARETAARVAAGALARKVLSHVLGREVAIRGALIELGGIAVERARWDWSEVERNPFWSPDAGVVLPWQERLDEARKAGSSLGALVEVIATGAPVGLGAPIYGKLDSDLAAAMMGINAVKGVEIGAGFAAARLTGEENADEMRMKDGQVEFLSNKAGGILGGISTGQDVIVRFAVKPTSSIHTPRRSVTTKGENVEVSTTGRHDPCVGIRAVPVGEAMMAVVLADHLLRHRAQVGIAT
jgi:chorismate synthase